MWLWQGLVEAKLPQYPLGVVNCNTFPWHQFCWEQVRCHNSQLGLGLHRNSLPKWQAYLLTVFHAFVIPRNVRLQIVSLLFVNYLGQRSVGRLLHTCPPQHLCSVNISALFVLPKPSVDTTSPICIVGNLITLGARTLNCSHKNICIEVVSAWVTTS